MRTPSAKPVHRRTRCGGPSSPAEPDRLECRVLLPLLAAALLVACAQPVDLRPTRTLAAPVGAVAAPTPWPAADWWRRYGEPRLDALVERALAGQPSLQQALARVQQAQAAVLAADAARLPQLAASADATVQRFSEHGLVPPALAGRTRWNSTLQVGGQWEPDFFGRQRAALDTAIGHARATAADAQAARTRLAAEVVAAWVALARLGELHDVASRALAQRQQVHALVRERVGAGLDTQLELRQAEGLIAQSRAEIEALAEAADRARHALAELGGQPPDGLAGLSPRLPEAAAAVLPETLPADLLGRRADLVAQRWRVEAALHDVEVARAQFHPNINLLAFVGLSSLGLSRLVEAGSATFGVGPALRLPLFDAGRLRARLADRAAEADAAIEAYNAALLRALREVADELSSLRSLERQQQAQADATAAADGAYALALQRYRAGIGNFLVVLTAEANVLVQRRAAGELKARRLAADAALARALGGGFEAEALPATAAVEPGR